MSTLRFLDDIAFKCLRGGDIAEFHRVIEGRTTVDFSGTDLRGTDFRKADLRKVILRDSYLRDADLRGCDLRQMDLSGATIQDARVGGTYFPDSLPAEEIMMSLKHGTRLRTKKV
jgi:uncharacterized protein YjbI with pentapeptide repeats